MPRAIRITRQADDVDSWKFEQGHHRLFKAVSRGLHSSITNSAWHQTDLNEQILQRVHQRQGPFAHERNAMAIVDRVCQISGKRRDLQSGGNGQRSSDLMD